MKPKNRHILLTTFCAVATVGILYVTISKIKTSSNNILKSKILQLLVGASGLMIGLLALSLYFTVKENKGISIAELKNKEPRTLYHLGVANKEMALIVKISPGESISTSRNIKKFELDDSQKFTLTDVNNEKIEIHIDDCQLINKSPDFSQCIKENSTHDNLILYLDMNNEYIKNFNNFVVRNLSYDNKTKYKLTGKFLTNKKYNIYTVNDNSNTENKYKLICEKEYKQQKNKDFDKYYFLEKDLDILFNLKYKINSKNNKLEPCESMSQKIKDKILSSIENQIMFELATSNDSIGKSTNEKLKSLFSVEEQENFNKYKELFNNHLENLKKLPDNDRTIEKSQELLEKELENNQEKDLIKAAFSNILTGNKSYTGKKLISITPDDYLQLARSNIVKLIIDIAKENGISTLDYTYSENSSLNCNINEVYLYKSPSHIVTPSNTQNVNEYKSRP